MIYLDHNATTPVLPVVREAMSPFFDQAFGNASSAHRAGALARAAVEESRRILATRIGASPSEVFFTSGGTESNNLALFGSVSRDGHCAVSPIEHSSVLGCTDELARRGRCVTELTVDDMGRIILESLEKALRSGAKVVSVGWANNEIGTVQPIQEISTLCHSYGALLHSDAVQAFGKINVDVAGIDLCSLSAHKCGGPKGIGALFVRRGIRLKPLLFGGGQEREVRPGTENVAAIVGFAAAVSAASELSRLESLRERLWGGLCTLGGVIRNSPAEDCLPNTLNLSLDGIRADGFVAAMDLEGIAISVGSACAAGAGESSHVLRAIGRTESEARDGIRFSIGPNTTAAEIETTIECATRVVSRMRGVTRVVPAGTEESRANARSTRNHVPA